MSRYYYDSDDSLEATGEIVFDPVAKKDPSGKMFKPWWVICLLHCDIPEYYSRFLEITYGLVLQQPAWGAHISIVRGEEVERCIWDTIKDKYHKKPLKFTYQVSPRTNGKHWWLRVQSEVFSQIRTELGLSLEGEFSFHLTLGMPTPRHEQLSMNIWKSYNNFINLQV